jgi:hypothetical protein
MLLLRIACLLSALCLAACDRFPESYPPPEQRQPLQGFNPGPDAMMVSMEGFEADPLIIRDIYGNSPGIPWRWTRKEPAVRVPLLSTEGLRYSIDFTLWDESFKVTGPVEISFLVNDKLLDKVRYTTPGNKHFEKPVPADWLATNTEATVGMSLDKVYTAPHDGAKFGVILTRLGLRP